MDSHRFGHVHVRCAYRMVYIRGRKLRVPDRVGTVSSIDGKNSGRVDAVSGVDEFDSDRAERGTQFCFRDPHRVGFFWSFLRELWNPDRVVRPGPRWPRRIRLRAVDTIRRCAASDTDYELLIVQPIE